VSKVFYLQLHQKRQYNFPTNERSDSINASLTANSKGVEFKSWRCPCRLADAKLDMLCAKDMGKQDFQANRHLQQNAAD